MSDSRGNEAALENEISVAVNTSGRKKIVYIWDMDETLILLKSLLDGTYAVGFSGMKDVQRGIEIGKMWENLILEVCDDYFFYDQVESYNEPYIDALSTYDDGVDLSDYDFGQDSVGPPADDHNKRKLAYRHRIIAQKYKQGLLSILDQKKIEQWNDLYEMTDSYTDKWLSSDKAMERLSDAKKGAVDPIAHQAAMVKRKNELQNSKQERASSEASRPIQVLKIKGLPPFVKKRKESGSLSKEKESAAKKQRTDTTKAVSVASEGQKDNKKEKKKDEKRKEEKRERKEKRSKGSSSEGRSKRIHDRQASHISGGSVSKPKGDIPMGIPLVSDALVYARKGKSVDNTSSPSKGREDVLALLETGFPPSHKQRLRDYLTSVMPKFPLERVFDQSSADDREEPEEDEYHTIPTQSGKFSGETRADMLKEWTKHVPAGYPQSLRGYEEGHIGPIKAELANALIRLDGVNKAMARNRAENKQCIKLARHCDDYLMAELEQQELRHRDALDAMQTGLSAAKDTAAAALVRVDALLLEKENWEKEKTLAADLHRKEKEKLEKEIADLQVQLKSSNEEAEKWKKHTEEAAAKAEREYKALVEEAWGHVSGGTEFSYLDSFINWVIESKAAERNGTTPPPKPEVQFQEEEEDEGEEVGENGDSSSSSSGSSSGEDDEGKEKPEAQQETPVDETPQS